MTNKIIVIGIIGILVIGLVSLVLEVKSLRAEVIKLSEPPAYSTRVNAPRTTPNLARQNNQQYMPNQSWDPYEEMIQMHRQMNQLFNQASQNNLWNTTLPASDTYQLSTDIKDAKDKYTITMDLPGMEKSDINVEVKGKTLLISGNRSKDTEEKNTNYYMQERSFGSFSQAFPLPYDANASGISVEYTKGVLSVDIPKLAKVTPQKEETTKIKVN